MSHRVDQSKMSGKQKVLVILGVILAVTLLGIVGRNDVEAEKAQAGILTQETVPGEYSRGKMDVVYHACNNSRMNLPGYTEQTCRALLDAYGYDFICEEANSLPSNQCQMELL